MYTNDFGVLVMNCQNGQMAQHVPRGAFGVSLCRTAIVTRSGPFIHAGFKRQRTLISKYA
jgi:hypothetical protein